MLCCVYIALALIACYIVYEFLIRKPCVKEIHKKYVFITGCDTGFGRRSAEKFDKLGCHVIAGCLKDESITELMKDCSSRLLAVKLDVTKDTEVQNAASDVAKHIPENEGLYCLINNAGLLGSVGPLAWISTEKFHQLLDVNLYGMHRVTKAFLPLLKKCPGSRIVNTASVVGRLTLPNTGLYCISKQAVESFSDALRRELRCFGISVHIIEPGGHRTLFMEKEAVLKAVHKNWNDLSPTMQQEYGVAYLDKMIYLSTDLIPSISTSTPEGVVKAYEHATFGKFPKTRYTIGADSPGYIIMSYLPSRIQDWVFSIKFVEPRPATYNS